MGELSLADELGTWPLFAQLSGDQLAGLAATAQVVQLSRGETLFRRGEPATRCYGVRHGMVQLTLSTSDGATKVAELIGPSETFGEAVMFLEGTFPVDASAVVASAVVRVPAEAIFAVTDTDPRSARKLLAALSMRIHQRMQDIEMYTLFSASKRVVAYLAKTDQRQVELVPSKKIVASRLGVTPETLSRVLAELVAAGIVSVSGRVVTVHDRARLAEVLA